MMAKVMYQHTLMFSDFGLLTPYLSAVSTSDGTGFSKGKVSYGKGGEKRNIFLQSF